MPMLQLLITPMMFLSGSLFPLGGLPGWLSVVTRLNPLTYVVQPMRHLVLQHLDLTSAEQVKLLPAITWAGWEVPIAVQLLTVAVITLGLVAWAARLFRVAE
jgi:ABC-2 type transport system permease protein